MVENQDCTWFHYRINYLDLLGNTYSWHNMVMSRVSVNPALIYSPDSKQVLDKNTKKTINSSESLNLQKRAGDRVELSEKSKVLKKELSGAEQALKIHRKKFGNIQKPGIYFVSGFDWFGASSVKGNYDGIRDMAEAVEDAQHFSWDQTDEIVEDIKKRDPNQPLILVGHSFGGDGVVEIAKELNTIENGFRKIDLLVTLDSVGFDNDFIPQNVKKNLNYLAQGPYKWLNDGPNIAMNYERTEVKNYLRSEEHADLDDSTDVQITVLESINQILSQSQVAKA